jgi:hypothetical protein
MKYRESQLSFAGVSHSTEAKRDGRTGQEMVMALNCIGHSKTTPWKMGVARIQRANAQQGEFLLQNRS